MMTPPSIPSKIQHIIEITRAYQYAQWRGASTSEAIAVAFVLNRMELLPNGYTDVIAAWDRLGDWQGYVRIIKDRYMHLIESATPNQ